MGLMCSTCGGGCSAGKCQRGRFQWGFGGENRCFLKGRLDGVDLTPLDLCSWLYCHETDTKMTLVPNGEDSYIQYSSERDINGCEGEETEPDRIYICDLLNLGSIQCLADVSSKPPKSCDLFVFNPSCDDEDCEDCAGEDQVDKWVPYTIPDAGDCVAEADAEGYFHVLTKDSCGCIKECKIKDFGDTYQYVLRDSYPDDPDWPFTYGNYSESIDLKLAQHVPELFGKSDLEVTVQYGFGVGIPNSTPMGNIQSLAIPTQIGGVSDIVNNAIVLQDTTVLPWGTWEKQASRTILVPSGRGLSLEHSVIVRTQSSVPGPYITQWDGQSYDGVGPAGSAKTHFSRLHALVVTVRATRRHNKGNVQ